MFNTTRAKKTKENTEEFSSKYNEKKLHSSLADNINLFKEIFSNDDTIIYRGFSNQNNESIKCCVIYVEGMANSAIIYESIIKPILENKFLNDKKDFFNDLFNKVIISNDIEKTSSIQIMLQSIISGDTLLLINGSKEALVIGSKGWQIRSIDEPTSEMAVLAPREGFTESLMVNLSLFRRKLQTPDLKFNFITLGVRSNTRICISYIEGIANEKILQELYKRLKDIEIDAILGISYVQELIKDSPLSIFETIGYTERPDVVSAKLLEGRIAIFIEGNPFVITVPHLFMEYFQVNEDYFENFYSGSIIRIFRVMGFILTITVSALYVSFTTFHQELIPTPLLLSIMAARKGIPFPTIVSALVMTLVFELLREAGARMPTYIGQALSIVGTLVIGQAAVDARLVSAPMVIVIAFSSITSLMITKIKTAALLLRIIFLILASFLGIYGILAGCIGLLIHLYEIRSFGVPYMANLELSSFDFQDLKDTFIRAPWWYMNYRPKFIAAKNFKRKTSGGRKS